MMIHLNGVLMSAAEARLDPTDRGLILGDGLFETIRGKDGRPLRLAAHLARLGSGAQVLGIPVPLSDGALGEALAGTLRANGLADGVLRLTLTRGPAPRGLPPPAEPRPTLLITAHAVEASSPAPVRAVVAATRRNEHSPLARCKSTNRLDDILARLEAGQRGVDEALLLNTAGSLAEATVANLFLVVDGGVVTPPVADGALPGVMRAEVIKATEARERSLGPEDLRRASEAFLTNSLGIRPLISVDGVAVGGGRPGPVTERLQAAL